MDNIHEIFKNFGSAMVTKHFDFEPMYKKGSMVERLTIKKSKDLLKTAAEAISNYNDNHEEFCASVYLLNKIANTPDSDWNSFCDDVTETVVKTAATAIAIPIGGLLGASATMLANAPGIVAKTIPMVGQTGGTAISSVEHLIGEDDVNTEKLKAAIAKYKLLTAKLDREINTRYVDLTKLDNAERKRKKIRDSGLV